jgi:hypothetical protein
MSGVISRSFGKEWHKYVTSNIALKTLHKIRKIEMREAVNVKKRVQEMNTKVTGKTLRNNGKHYNTTPSR